MAVAEALRRARQRSLAVRTPDPVPGLSFLSLPDCIQPAFILSLSAAAQFGRPDTGHLQKFEKVAFATFSIRAGRQPMGPPPLFLL